jgi:hypothetical protein
LSSFHDFGLAEPITRALADERYVVPTPIPNRHFPVALSKHDVVGIGQLDPVTAAVVTSPILHQLTIQRTREPIAFIRAEHRADKHAPGPVKVGASAEATHSIASQSQHPLAGVGSGVAVRGKHVGGISHDVNCDLLDVLASYVPWKGTTCSTIRRRYFALRCRRNVGAAGNREADWYITFATNQRTVRPPQHWRAKFPPRRLIGAGRLPIIAANPLRAAGRTDQRTDPRRAPTPDNRHVPPGFADVGALCGQMTISTVKQNQRGRSNGQGRIDSV